MTTHNITLNGTTYKIELNQNGLAVVNSIPVCKFIAPISSKRRALLALRYYQAKETECEPS